MVTVGWIGKCLTCRDSLTLAEGFGWCFAYQAITELVFNVLDQITIVVTPAHVKKNETVQRVAVACCMDFCIHDVEARTTEETDHAGKEILDEEMRV